jgi:hypothetical protein
MTAIIALPDNEALNLLYKKKRANDTYLLPCRRAFSKSALFHPKHPGNVMLSGAKHLHFMARDPSVATNAPSG